MRCVAEERPEHQLAREVAFMADPNGNMKVSHGIEVYITETRGGAGEKEGKRTGRGLGE